MTSRRSHPLVDVDVYPPFCPVVDNDVEKVEITKILVAHKTIKSELQNLLTQYTKAHEETLALRREIGVLEEQMQKKIQGTD